MEEKNRYLLSELLFTFLLIESVILLFGGILSPYGVYFSIGLIGGLSFSWFIRDKQIPSTKLTVNIAVLGVFFWIIYSLLHSSFLYKEVIAIFIQGLIIIQVIFSFNIRYTGFLTYVQALSIPLFMCFPIFAKDYNEGQIILVLVYIICWIIILKIKFYEFVKAQREKKIRRYLQIVISMAIFLIILSVTWTLFNYITLGEIAKRGILFEESMGSEAEKDLLEKEYYILQDEIQKEILGIIPELDFHEDKQETIMLLSSLLKDSISAIEVQKARLGLISRMKEPGPGLEAKGGEISAAIEKYIERKIKFNMNKTREEIMNNLKQNRFNLMEMFSLSDKINKMESADSNQKIKKYARDIKKGIDNSSAAGNAERDLCKLADQLKEWKTYDAYREKSDSLNKESDSLQGKLKEKLSDLLSDINNAEGISELKDAEEKAGELEETLLLAGKDAINKTKEMLESKSKTPLSQKAEGLKKEKAGELEETLLLAGKDAINKTKEMLELKSEMLLSQKAAELKKEIDDLKLPEDYREELKEKVGSIKDAMDYREFSGSVSKYREKIREGKISVPEKTEGLLETKAHLLFNAKKDEIRKELEKSKLPDKGKEFMNDLEKLEDENSREKLIADTEKLKENIKEFSEQGFISNESNNKLMEDMEKIKDILLSKMEAGNKYLQSQRDEEKSMGDYQKELEELIEKSSLNEEKKETLRQLAQALKRAQSISQIDNIKEAAESEIKDLPTDKTKQEDIEIIKEAFNTSIEIKRIFMTEKVISALREKTEDLRKVSPKVAEIIRGDLEKIAESRTEKELKKRIDILKKDADSQNQEKEEKSEEIKRGAVDISILPARPVIPLGSSVSLRVIAVYNKTLIKELGPQVQWFSSEPYVAWVDEAGIIHTLAKGKTQIYVKYAGQESEKIEVTVVDNIDEQISKAVERESIR
ncbi:MAG: hypothetical protein ABH806_00200 [Candidatus Omnitrophota bacterium]